MVSGCWMGGAHQVERKGGDGIAAQNQRVNVDVGGGRELGVLQENPGDEQEGEAAWRHIVHRCDGIQLQVAALLQQDLRMQ